MTTTSREIAERMVESLGKLITESLDQMQTSGVDPGETASVLVDRFREMVQEFAGPKWAPMVTGYLDGSTKQSLSFVLAILLDVHAARKKAE